MSDCEQKKKRPHYKTLREALKDNPNSGQRVVGAGTVCVDPEKIRRSKNYRDLIAKVREFAEAS
jgi:hypothetical protein